MDLKGFKEFVLKGNLVELAVAFIMATAFAKVVEEFTAVLMGFIGKVFDEPNFNIEIADVQVGLFITALVSFLILAAVVYYFVVTPYNIAKAKFMAEDPVDAKPDEVLLLEEIRNLLATRNGGPGQV
ncbi:MscL family protein [Nocardioides alcanivorans]|uniref:MscL family protein n=1 Tax=Nocardioides alcanivorans TaxID=2897352 RepID=UPI001F1CF84C|nr:MscL family protein [Nocardioides alcanivorans]